MNIQVQDYFTSWPNNCFCLPRSGRVLALRRFLLWSCFVNFYEGV